MAAQHFDFFRVGSTGGFDAFGTSIAEDAEGDLDDVALVFVASHGELFITLAEAFFGKTDAGAAEFGLVESSRRIGIFDDVFRDALSIMSAAQELKHMDGGDGGGGMRNSAVSGLGRIGRELGEVFNFFQFLPVGKPLTITGGTPIGEILSINGRCLELGGQDFFDGGEFIEPGQDLVAPLAIQEAEVDLLAEISGETGDFSDGRAHIISCGFLGHYSINGEKVIGSDELKMKNDKRKDL